MHISVARLGVVAIMPKNKWFSVTDRIGEKGES
jgi:hypothetical protein